MGQKQKLDDPHEIQASVFESCRDGSEHGSFWSYDGPIFHGIGENFGLTMKILVQIQSQPE